MSADLVALAQEAVDWMRAQSAQTQSEVYLSLGEDRTLARRDGAREVVESASSFGAGVRVVRDGRAGFASAGAADREALQALWRLAVEQLPHSAPEPGRALPSPATGAGDEDAAFSASLWDETLLTRPWDALEARLAEAEAAAGTDARARVLRAEISESVVESVVASTRGVLARERGGSADVWVCAAAGDGADTQIGEAARSARRFDALETGAAGREALRRAVSALGARRTRSGRRAVVFEPWVGVEFLELLSELLSAEEVQGGRSLLAGRLGGRVASPLVTLRDDPRRLGGPASARFDDEGVPTRDKAVIERGILRELFYDAATAARAGVAPNGCGYRGGWNSLPGPGASNLYVAPGAASRESVLAGAKDGLLVLEMLGAHMMDPVSGEFSVGVSGLELSGGEPGPAFNGAMISGNLLDLLARVDAVADDLCFSGGLGAPTLRVEALDVA